MANPTPAPPPPTGGPAGPDAGVLQTGRKGRRIPWSERERNSLELDIRTLLADGEASGRWFRAFGAARPLRVEIGFGNSEFLLRVAEGEPDFNYLGFEYSPKRVTKFLKRVETRRLTNIRALRVDAGPTLEALVEPGSVDAFFILFPDPWPKQRHAKHRLIQPAAAALFVRLLAPGGGLSLRSDDPCYAAQMLAVLEGIPGLVNTSGPGRFAAEPRHPFPTTYELKYRRAGRTIHYLEYRREATDHP
jgi:tRNA (guanine-N7-)-methyltransferase